MLAAKAIPRNAVELLEADHAQVRTWIAQFEKARVKREQHHLATHICSALMAHLEIEEDILYPAFFEATKDKHMYDEAIEEHKRAKNTIEEVARLTADGGETRRRCPRGSMVARAKVSRLKPADCRLLFSPMRQVISSERPRYSIDSLRSQSHRRVERNQAALDTF